MKKIFVILIGFICLFANSQTNYYNGYNEGYKKGYCQRAGGSCISPVPPVAPIPRVGENNNNYNDGYNRGFEIGYLSANTSGERFQKKYQGTPAEFLDLNNSSNLTGNRVVDLKMKIIDGIIYRAKQNMDNENYDAAIDNANDLLEVQDGSAIAYLIKSIAYYNKDEIVNAYNFSWIAYNIYESDEITTWRDKVVIELIVFLNTLMTNEQFNYMRQICLKLKPQINLAKYFLGISYYYLNDYQNAKKAFLSSDLEIESLSISSKKYLESINNNTYISNPLKNN